jgi:RHS repeat-associated protein
VLAQCGTTATAPSYFLYDGHGSTRQLTSTNAIVTSRYNYDSYGATLASSSTTPETSLLYCGEQLDSTLGMYNLRARFYDAFNGRFNQKDLFEGDAFTPQSLHRYAYAHLDPVTEQDPSGESVEGTLVITALLLVVLLFVLDTPPRPTIRPLNSQEQAQVDRVLNGMASYDRLGRVKHHVTALRLREYRVDFSLKHEKPTDADTQGYTYPSREPNRIYLAPFIFTDTTFNEFSIDWTVTFSGHLMDVMVHEDLHLELGKSDPSGAYVDQVADLANGPYLKTMHSQMAAERKNLNRR